MPPSKKRLARKNAGRRPASAPEEQLVNDARAGLTPAQMVERKLVTLLRGAILPTSHLQVSQIRRTLS